MRMDILVPEVLQVGHLLLLWDSLNIPLFSEPKISQNGSASPLLRGHSVPVSPASHESSASPACFRNIRGRKSELVFRLTPDTKYDFIKNICKNPET